MSPFWFIYLVLLYAAMVGALIVLNHAAALARRAEEEGGQK